jgi:hypothetical protein
MLNKHRHAELVSATQTVSATLMRSQNEFGMTNNNSNSMCHTHEILK